MAKVKTPIPKLKELKQEKKKIRMVTAYDYPTAVIVDRTDIELILVGDSLGMVVLGYDGTVKVTMEDMIHHIAPVVKGAPNTLVVGDMPFGAYNETREQAIHNATRLMKGGGCDCIKLEGGMNMVDTVRAIVNAGIPVMGHIGLTPQTSSQLGGFKVQAKDVDSVRKIIDEARALEDAGAFSLVVECVPAQVGRLISEAIAIPTIGIGAGPDCDGQVLVTQDMIGMFDKFLPKFVKQYANVGEVMRDAFNRFSQEVEQGVFPAPEHCFNIKEDVLKKLC